MGMQLYDPAVVASQLIEVATNLSKSTLGNIGLGFKVNKTETAYQMRISEIIKNTLDPKSYETSECFFTFSNNRFTDLLEKSELKRSNAYNFATTENSGVTVSMDSAYDILNEFSDDAILNENKDVITRAINEVTANITNEVLPSDKYNLQLSLVQELIKSLVFVIVNTLLTPKIVSKGVKTRQNWLNGVKLIYMQKHRKSEDFRCFVSEIIGNTAAISAWRTEVHVLQPSDRTSFFPSFWGRGS
jgi:hypothetical protein